MRIASSTLVRGDGVVVCDSCGVAGTFATRLRGLLGRGVALRPDGVTA